MKQIKKAALVMSISGAVIASVTALSINSTGTTMLSLVAGVNSNDYDTSGHPPQGTTAELASYDTSGHPPQGTTAEELVSYDTSGHPPQGTTAEELVSYDTSGHPP